jgi:hypothetical protein
VRCYACDVILTDEEATRKSKTTNQYLDLCDTCYDEVADTFIEEEEKQDIQIKESA